MRRVTSSCECTNACWGTTGGRSSAQMEYDGMLARCRALQLFLEVAVVDDQRLLDLFTDAGLPSHSAS